MNRNPAHLRSLLLQLEPLVARIELTDHPGHAAEIARAAHDFEGIAVAGGDGTLFEVLQVLDREQKRVAIIPAGRGNSLARDLGMMRPGMHMAALHWEPRTVIDLLQVSVTTANGTTANYLSASTIALGYAVTVARRSRRLRLGTTSYALAAVVTRPRRCKMQVVLDGGAPLDLRLCGIIANNTHHIANFHNYRQANCSDGVFEVMQMDGGLVRQAAHNLSALSGTGLYEPYPLQQAAKARVCLDAPQDLLLDGEILSNVTAIEVRILPGALACNRPRALG